jgi:HK97 family phage portal protein
MNIFGFEINKAPRRNSQSAKRETDLSKTKIPATLPSFSMQADNYLYQQYLQQYRSWVYVCANKNAGAVAKQQLKLYVSKPGHNTKLLCPTRTVNKGLLKRLEQKNHLRKYITASDYQVEEVLDHPFLDLLAKVNDWSNRYDMWTLTQLYLELTGNAYWYLPESKGNAGVPEQMFVLMSQYVKILTDPVKFIKGYEFRQGSSVVEFTNDEIIHFKFPNPSSNYYGFAPLSAIGLAVQLHGNMQTFELTLLKNNAAPEGILSTEKTLGSDEYERLKKQWYERYSGYQKVGKTPLLEGGLTYQQLGMSQRDMLFPAGRKDLREEIVAAFGVPMSKVTTQNVNLANAEIGEEQYLNDTIQPRLTLIEEKLNEKLMYRYDENLFVAYDPVGIEDKQFALTTRESNLKNYVTTVNEERVAQGMDEVDWGAVPLAMPGIAPLGSQQAEPAQPEIEQPEAPVEEEVLADTQKVIDTDVLADKVLTRAIQKARERFSSKKERRAQV